MPVVPKNFLCSLLLLAWFAIPASSADNPGQENFTPEQIEYFESHVRPILVAHCFDCHSTDAKELKAGLYVDSREGILKGGESGPALVPGDPDASELIAAIKYESTEMPPDRKLPPKVIAALSRWVEMGAPWPQVTSSPGIITQPDEEIDWSAARESHWAWQPIVKPDVPAASAHGGETSSHNEIDRFVDARRNEAGLATAGPATSRTLVRRIYLDLVGIVPTPEQIDQFESAARHDRRQAVASLVDQLLQSPLYGQRWGRHWLDVARYSDGRGGFLDNQSLDEAWRYRDWVVEAINDDLPIDQFLRLQIAGDVIGDYHDAVATGFFALGPTYRSDGGDPDSVAQAKGETLDDRIDTLTRGLLGITGSCARCHDHKFDPIPQLDYYSLAGVFNNSAVHKQPLAEAEVVARFNEHRNRVNDLNKKTKDLNRKLKKEKREATADEQTQLDARNHELEQLKQNTPPGFDTAHTLRETGKADMHVALRGNLRKTGELAPRRFLRILSGPEPTKFASGSGRRELAEAITDPYNPLTARVFVNRIWMHHYGAGLVRTPSNFGSLGEKPTHPQLLDWLAADFMENGWSLKRLHRQIMNSAAYQQSSQFSEVGHRRDGDNRLLWRFSPRRMDVEAWRDSLLAVTGELDTTHGGRPLDNIAETPRRTIYAKVSRNGDVYKSDEFLRRFDFPLMRATVAKRPNSIVPQQYLFLLNSPFMVERARRLVARLDAEIASAGAPGSDEHRIRRAYKLLYGRAVEDLELQVGLQFLRTGSNTGEQLPAWERYAQALLSSNEFMYVR